MTNQGKAKQIIEDNKYCTVATATLDGSPWISPVFYSYDENYNIYWVSNKNAKHSELLRNNPKAAIVIFNSQADEGKGSGVYMEASVEELSEEDDIKKAMSVLEKRVKEEQFKVKRVEDVRGDATWRIYRATPEKIYKLIDGEYINGQYVDKKIEINI